MWELQADHLRGKRLNGTKHKQFKYFRAISKQVQVNAQKKIMFSSKLNHKPLTYWKEQEWMMLVQVMLQTANPLVHQVVCLSRHWKEIFSYEFLKHQKMLMVQCLINQRQQTARNYIKYHCILKKMENVGYITNYFSYNKMFKKMF